MSQQNYLIFSDWRFFSFANGAVSTTPVVNLELRISPRIFEKLRNGPNGILRGLGETNSWKKTRSQKSLGTVPLTDNPNPTRLLAPCSKIPESEILNLLKSPGIDSQSGGSTGLSGPPGYIGWRNCITGIDSWAPETFTNSGFAQTPSMNIS